MNKSRAFVAAPVQMFHCLLRYACIHRSIHVSSCFLGTSTSLHIPPCIAGRPRYGRLRIGWSRGYLWQPLCLDGISNLITSESKQFCSGTERRKVFNEDTSALTTEPQSGEIFLMGCGGLRFEE